MNFRRLGVLFLLLIPVWIFSQKKDVKQRYADSVEFATDEDKKTEYLLRLAELTQNENFIQSYEYSREAIRLAQKNRNVKALVRAYDALGDAYWFHTDYSKAQSYYFKSYRINDSLNDRRGIANSSYNIGWIICIQQKKYAEAHYFYKALNTFRNLSDTFGISKVYNALGNMFNDKYAADKEKSSFDSALKYYNLGIELQKVMKSNNKLAIFYSNIGQLMSLSGDFKSAIYYTEKSQYYFNKSQDSVGYFLNLANLSGYHTMIGEPDKALEMLHLSYLHCLRNDNRDILITIYKNYYDAYKAKKNTEKALFFLERYTSFNDSIQKEINSST
ncbi:MAG TPA: tetratricopeptide repeat protein, partial [Bacteroidia bacterium]|nr:tetratricopeptide repeat protein [Bacteroidia bacterium]